MARCILCGARCGLRHCSGVAEAQGARGPRVARPNAGPQRPPGRPRYPPLCAPRGSTWIGERRAALVGGIRLEIFLRTKGEGRFSEQIALRIRRLFEQVGQAELGPVLEQPAGQQGVSLALDPLVYQNRDLLTEVGSMVQASEFVALQGRFRSALKILPWGTHAVGRVPVARRTRKGKEVEEAAKEEM